MTIRASPQLATKGHHRIPARSQARALALAEQDGEASWKSTHMLGRAKDELWSLLDEKTADVPSQEVIIVAGDLNGHVSAAKDGYDCHGGLGFGSRNADGRLESRDGERFLYRLVNVHHRQAEDVEKLFGINDENGHLLMDRKMVLNRWRTYFEEVSTIEFAHPRIPSSSPVHGTVQKINVEEVEAAPKKMKPGNATSPADLAADLWKSKSWYPTKWLATFFNQVVSVIVYFPIQEMLQRTEKVEVGCC
ncbi:unnamed protein product [Heligmosomoides polygyrus]|uniref:Endo/exonuclease/phosphatase domain-containing protein n=1 Tax=Heligmosomoides polygyrus TaxID=6339 RepID=A0A183FXH9_HELPZ|nr:unnamed protein product [Heligmosomoides polygyrus]